MAEGPLTSDDGETLAWLSRAGLEGMAPEALLAAFCERLRGGGIALTRAQIGTAVVHPAIRGFSLTWWAGRGIADSHSFGHDQQAAPEWHRSPGAYMFANGINPISARLDGGDRAEPWFDLYDELSAAGLTGYHAELFPFGWSSSADRETQIPELGVITSWSTDRPGGFGGELARLRALLPVFALAVKGGVLTSMSETLMTTYLGRDAGRRVLHGDIHRGDTRVLRAAILLADLRGFTALTDRLSSETIVAMLDAYLAAICEPVQRRGGQVLKFLGDGLLAVFDDSDGNRADSALAAAREALARVDEINRRRAAAGEDYMVLDVALHAGEVAYGNVGGPDRLDFTVIGPAVNEAARMEAICGDLGRPLLVSAALAAELSDRSGLDDLGLHRLRGLERPRQLFGARADG